MDIRYFLWIDNLLWPDNFLWLDNFYPRNQFSSTFIHFHPFHALLSIIVHFHQFLSIFIHNHPQSSIFIHQTLILRAKSWKVKLSEWIHNVLVFQQIFCSRHESLIFGFNTSGAPRISAFPSYTESKFYLILG